MEVIGNNIPTTEASAQSILSQIFRHETRDTQIAEVNRAVTILQQFPALALKTYLTRRHPSARFPLFILAERGATLEQIKFLRQLNKESSDETSIASLSEAAATLSRMHVKPELMKIMEGGKAALDVLSYLIQEYPILVKQRDSIGSLPIHKFLQRRTYGFYPGQTDECDALALQMIQKYPDRCDFELFQLALHANCNDEIVDFLVQQLSQQLSQQQPRRQRSFNFQSSYNRTVSLRDARAVAKILPALQKFSFHLSPASASAEAFCHLMDSIAFTNSIQKLRITFNSGYLKSHGESTSKAFQRALNTPSLEQLILQFDTGHDYELRLLAEGMTTTANNDRFTTRLNSLRLRVSGTPSPQSVRPLLSILSCKNCPKSVHIDGGSWEHDDDNDNDDDDPVVIVPDLLGVPSESSLESLAFVGCHINVKAMEAILKETVRAPALQRFVLWLDADNSHSPKIMEDVVIPLFLHAQNLKEIELSRGDGIQFATICRLLNSNTTTAATLRKVCFTVVPGDRADSCKCILETLERDNTTLESLQFDGIQEQDDDGDDQQPSLLHRIGYFLHLNRNGRSRTRDLALTRSEFVDMLANVIIRNNNNNNNSEEGRQQQQQQQQQGGGAASSSSICEKHPGAHSILFGLLREDPALWASTDSYLKRRASLRSLPEQQQPAAGQRSSLLQNRQPGAQRRPAKKAKKA